MTTHLLFHKMFRQYSFYCILDVSKKIFNKAQVPQHGFQPNIMLVLGDIAEVEQCLTDQLLDVIGDTELKAVFRQLYSKGQIISKRVFSGRGFFRKTNENTSYTSKNEFIRFLEESSA